MTAIATKTDDLRLEAARLAFALLRFEGTAAHTGPVSHTPHPAPLGTDAYVFWPSLRRVPRNEVEAFLVGLPSPALLATTTSRGLVALTLLHELSGDRRRGVEKTLSNHAEGLDHMSAQSGWSPTSRVLLEFDDEFHVFSFAAVREWTQQFGVLVGWTIWPLKGDDRADACLMLLRSDGKPFRGKSCMLSNGRLGQKPGIGGTAV